MVESQLLCRKIGCSCVYAQPEGLACKIPAFEMQRFSFFFFLLYEQPNVPCTVLEVAFYATLKESINLHNFMSITMTLR